MFAEVGTGGPHFRWVFAAEPGFVILVGPGGNIVFREPFNGISSGAGGSVCVKRGAGGSGEDEQAEGGEQGEVVDSEADNEQLLFAGDSEHSAYVFPSLREILGEPACAVAGHAGRPSGKLVFRKLLSEESAELSVLSAGQSAVQTRNDLLLHAQLPHRQIRLAILLPLLLICLRSAHSGLVLHPRLQAVFPQISRPHPHFTLRSYLVSQCAIRHPGPEERPIIGFCGVGGFVFSNICVPGSIL